LIGVGVLCLRYPQRLLDDRDAAAASAHICVQLV
jgi:hypothetical protein